MKKHWVARLGVLGLVLILLLGGFAAKPVNAASDDNTFKVGMEAGYAPFNWTQNTDANNAVKIQAVMNTPMVTMFRLRGKSLRHCTRKSLWSKPLGMACRLL